MAFSSIQKWMKSKIGDWTREPTVTEKAEALLKRYRSAPLRALSEVISDRLVRDLDVAVAIALHEKCGIDGTAGRKDTESGVEITASPPMLAIQGDWPELVSELLSLGANTSYCDKIRFSSTTTALYRAATRNKTDIMTLLLDAGAIVGSEIEYLEPPLHGAVQSDCVRAMDLLLANGADIESNYEGSTPLLWALMHEKNHMARELVTRKANVDAFTQGASRWWSMGAEGWSAISHARSAGMVRFLADNSADINGANTYNFETPLHVASVDFQVLLDRGAEVDALDLNGETPLHAAARQNRFRDIRMLLDNSAIVEFPSQTLKTALHVAAEANAFEAAELLIKNGAKTNSRDDKGSTPSMLTQNQHILNLLTA